MIMAIGICSHAKVTVWVTEVERNPAIADLPHEPNGFFENIPWVEEDGISDYREFYFMFCGDNLATIDPNYVDHHVEVQPRDVFDGGIFICHAFKGWNDEFDITGNKQMVKWRPDPNDIYHQFNTENILGGTNQHYDQSVPKEWQNYYNGIVWAYIDLTLEDFMKRWLQNYPPFDFNKDGIVNLLDYSIFVRSVL
jgi:hypothetical protein